MLSIKGRVEAITVVYESVRRQFWPIRVAPPIKYSELEFDYYHYYYYITTAYIFTHIYRKLYI